MVDSIRKRENETREVITKMLKAFRVSGMTDNEIAEELEICTRTLQRWRANQTFPNAPHWIGLQQMLDELLGQDDVGAS